MSNLIIVFQTQTDGDVYIDTIKTQGLNASMIAQKVEAFADRHRLTQDDYALFRGEVVKSFNMQSPLRGK